MTASEWDACSDPAPMLEYLRGKASDRELRLFAVECCRRVWLLLSDEWIQGIEVAEHFACEWATEEELSRTLAELTYNFREIIESDNGAAKQAVLAALHPGSPYDPRDAASAASRSEGCREDEDGARLAEQHWQADLVRAWFGDQFRPVAG